MSSGSPSPPPTENIWRAPLVPVALALTAGLVLDRFYPVPLPISLITVIASLAAWVLVRSPASPGLPLVYLWVAIGALGAAYHHGYRDVYAPDDIGNFATVEARPAWLRGFIAEEPSIIWSSGDDPLRSMAQSEPTVAELRVTLYHDLDGWRDASGRARLVIGGHVDNLHVGDEVEVIGRLIAPHGPVNPGEPDPRAQLLDQRIRAIVQVQKTTEAVTRITQGWLTAPATWPAQIRGWGQRELAKVLPAHEGGLAMALLLGEGSTLTPADWDRYKRAGVVHLLVIAGYHLVVLATFLWGGLRLCGVRRRRGALVVALVLLGYAVLTGGRPPVMRAAITVCSACGGLMLLRTTLPANAFALAWIVVAALNPTDLFTPGCQLSFLAVALLYWGAGRWLMDQPDALDDLIVASQPTWRRWLGAAGTKIRATYAITIVLWLASAPLVAKYYHMVSPVGMLILPPLMLLMSVALIAGFLLLLTALLVPFLAPLPAALTNGCLSVCDWVVAQSDRLPGAHWYVGDVPTWWLWVFYPALLAVVLLEPLRQRWRWALPAALAWLCVGMIGCSDRPASDELRVTFVAVGHGGCTVIEAPDGRVAIYDAGALGGPDVTVRHIAPFLWSRGIRRIDEVFLSHADLDHFNGLPALLDRFTVGQVTTTPTFADRNTPGVRATLESLERHRIPYRIVRSGDRLTLGDVVIDVLHPPVDGPPGKENHRSLVLLLTHEGHSLLLTGDLEGPGLERVLAMPRMVVDVLMAPHHGSKTSNTPTLADWAKPRVVISCEGLPRGSERPPEPYTERRAKFLGTWPHGAITLRSSPGILWVEAFQSGERFVVPERRP